jgi:hypothetical protein
MVRSGALTLGAFLMLGGVSGAEADDLWSLGPGALPALGGVMPSLPQNWSDLPFTIHVDEGVGYNSNIINSPSHSTAGVSPTASLFVQNPISSFYSTSTYQASTRYVVYGQELFADGTFGLTRYLNNTRYNTQTHGADAGVNWTYGSRCSGKLIAAEATTPSQPGALNNQPTNTIINPTNQVGFNVINTTTTISFNETANCGISSNYTGIFNTGTSTSTNSAAADQINNSQATFVAAGISYNVTETNTLELLATVTGTTYPDRSTALNSQGLLNSITEDQVNLSYTKTFSPTFNTIASVGFASSSPGDFNFALPRKLEPQFSFTFNWFPTPKLSFVASVSRVVTPPTAIIANLQVSELISLNAVYALTPKLSLSGGVSASQTSGAFTSVAATAIQPLSATTTDYAFRAALAYLMTPFTTATLSFQYNRSVQANLVTPDNLVLLRLSYAPH